ncbi:MAG: transglutaminase-like domain-containing protein [Bacteroidetes bacterium]|nr:transglutaminase-like domain-containing protein [Bacteroidota bacterium]
MRKFHYLFVFMLFFSCGPREFEPPAEVKEVLDLAGNNRSELEKVIQHFKNESHVIREEAAYFLIGNMKNHGYLEYKLVDSTGAEVDFNVLDYEDYDALLDRWDDIENNRGKIHFEKDTFYHDYNEITADYLIKNINLAYKAWDENPWAAHLSFEQFCEYILPYRSSNEPIEEWREYFINELTWVMDSIKDPSDPIEAACYVNDYIKSWFRFDPRYYEHPTDQGLQEMLSQKMGRCEDMTNLAIYAMRALGIPVMSDFTPYWANTGNNHAWNAILDKNDSTIIFMGGEANPGDYSLGHKMAKVYRKTYAIQQNSLPEKMEKWEKAPPYLNSNSIRDVTPEYVPTKTLKIELARGVPDSTHFAYICVFNSGEWKAIAYTRLYGNRASYSKMGLDVAYLPGFYIDKQIVPAGFPFILTKDGNMDAKDPDGNNRIDVKLYSTTKRITKETTDFIEHAEFNTGKTYILYYWNDKWVEAGKRIAGDEALVYKNVPSNAIYWLVEEGSRKEERIFTINDEGEQVWW